jgi:hypothetical protein
MGPRRIVPTPIQRQDGDAAAPEQGFQFSAAPDSRAAVPLLADSVDVPQEPGRRIKVDLLADSTVDLHALIRKSLHLAKPTPDAPGATAASGLPKPLELVRHQE